jgi:hypothetical protein
LANIADFFTKALPVARHRALAPLIAMSVDLCGFIGSTLKQNPKKLFTNLLKEYKKILHLLSILHSHSETKTPKIYLRSKPVFYA